MTRVQIVESRMSDGANSAWTKAPTDVAEIADELGFVRVAAGRFRPGGAAFVRRVLRKLRLERLMDCACWKLEMTALRHRFKGEGGELLLQHPLSGSWAFSLANVSDIARCLRFDTINTICRMP